MKLYHVDFTTKKYGTILGHWVAKDKAEAIKKAKQDYYVLKIIRVYPARNLNGKIMTDFDEDG